MALEVKTRWDEKQKQELLDRLNRFSQEMEQGSIESLYGIKELIDDYQFNLLELSQQIEPRIFSVIWILQEFLGDMWTNLGGDSYGFPEKEKPRMAEISKALGGFIQASLFKKEKEPMGSLTKAIENYFALLQICQDYWENPAGHKEKLVVL